MGCFRARRLYLFSFSSFLCNVVHGIVNGFHLSIDIGMVCENTLKPHAPLCVWMFYSYHATYDIKASTSTTPTT